MITQQLQKYEWKKTLNEVVQNQVEDQWKEDITDKSSLKYPNCMEVKVWSAHNLYKVRNIIIIIDI